MTETASILKELEALIWDFNGTLLDDTAVCINCMNIMLEQRSLPALTIERYREIFTFPVKDYYQALGFDFETEPFEIPAHQFIHLYRNGLKFAPLHEGVTETLRLARDKRIRQVVLSAMEQDFLVWTLESKAILSYFDKVAGIDNHLGNGKSELAAALLAGLGIPKDRVCLVGDTVHDYEVAVDTGIPCILIANGHQSYRRLKKLGCPVVKNLGQFHEMLVRAWSA
jgi:phosphoglycolate phosphatase